MARKPPGVLVDGVDARPDRAFDGGKCSSSSDDPSEDRSLFSFREDSELLDCLPRLLARDFKFFAATGGLLDGD
jgi:hypothetical protein